MMGISRAYSLFMIPMAFRACSIKLFMKEAFFCLEHGHCNEKDVKILNYDSDKRLNPELQRVKS